MSTYDSFWLKHFNINAGDMIGNYFFITKWQNPQLGLVKLNIDGCAKGNSSAAAGGSFVRNDTSRECCGVNLTSMAFLLT